MNSNDLYDSHGCLYQILLDALITGGINHIAEAAHKYLRHPFLITDAEYNIIVQIPNEKIGDFLWDSIFDNKNIEFDMIHVLSEEQLIEKGYETNNPIYVNWGAFEKYPRVLSNIMIDGSIAGYSAVIYSEGICTEQDIENIELINKIISIEFQRQNISGYATENFQNLFLKNLLEGKIKNHEDLSLWKSNLNEKFNGKYLVLAAESNKGINEVLSLPYIRKNILSYYPTLVGAILDDRIYILIANISEQNLFEAKLNNILKFLMKYNLKVGISNVFSEIIDLHIYRKQADFALNESLSIADSKLCFYQDFALNEIFQAVKKNMHRQSYIHPAIEKLIEYDKEKKTEYFSTLYHYILSMCNGPETTERLHIHRNTLPYRLKMIEKIADINLNDNKTCANLLCSLYLYKQIK